MAQLENHFFYRSSFEREAPQTYTRGERGGIGFVRPVKFRLLSQGVSIGALWFIFTPQNSPPHLSFQEMEEIVIIGDEDALW